jgi:hypothetical protein
MAYSASQLIAISGFSQNLGLQVSQVMQNKITACTSTTVLSGKINRAVLHPSASSTVKNHVRSNIPGIGLVAPSAYTMPTGIDTINVLGSLLTLANGYFTNGVSGYLSILGTATNACRISRDILGSLYVLESEGFSSAGPDISSHIDLVTGGISSKFGPLAVGSQDYFRASGLYSGTGATTSTPADIKRSIVAVADAISGLGTLYDFQQLETLGTAQHLINNLVAQGLIKTDFINGFSNENVNINNLALSSEATLIGILEKITGSEVLRIISGTGLQVPSNSIINNAADFLKTEKVIETSAVNAIPGGTLKDLALRLRSLNVNFETKNDLVEAFKNIEILDTPQLNNLSSPLPSADITSLRTAFPSGSGDFGSPYIQEVIGTPAGYVHNDSLDTIFRVIASISGNAAAVTLASASDALYAKYVAGGSATAEETAFTNAIDTLVAVSDLETLLAEADDAILDMLDEITLEEENQSRAGLSLTINIPGSIAIGQLSSVLTTFGTDAFNSGATPMLLDMLTDDIYGEATRAVLLQGSNEQILKTIGKETIGISDIEKAALGVRAIAGEGLTPQQRENVIEDARARNLDINNALANAVFYGYNNQYYVSRGFPPA